MSPKKKYPPRIMQLAVRSRSLAPSLGRLSVCPRILEPRHNRLLNQSRTWTNGTYDNGGGMWPVVYASSAMHHS